MLVLPNSLSPFFFLKDSTFSVEGPYISLKTAAIRVFFPAPGGP